MLSAKILRFNGLRILSRNYSEIPKPPGTSSINQGINTPVKPKPVADVPGLSSKIVKSVSTPVGPGASVTGNYKVPEYYCYNNLSYYEAEIEMERFRCPQPSALK